MRAKIILSGFSMVLVFLVFVAGLFVFATAITTGRNGVQNFFGYSFLNISTQSMDPVYPVGTVVITRKADPAVLKTGDVISFYSLDPDILNLPNTHRIYAVEKSDTGELQFITKGDNNPVPDSYPVDSGRIIGVVTGSVKSVGKVINVFNNRYVLFFVFIVPLFIFAAIEVANIGKIVKRKDSEPEDKPSGQENTEVNP